MLVSEGGTYGMISGLMPFLINNYLQFKRHWNENGCGHGIQNDHNLQTRHQKSHNSEDIPK